MPSLHEILELLRKPLQLERQMGCRNAAVFGGVDRFMAQWTGSAREVAPVEHREVLDELGALFADYEVLPTEGRRARLDRGLQLIEALSRGGRPSPSQAVPGPVPAASQPLAVVPCAPAAWRGESPPPSPGPSTSAAAPDVSPPPEAAARGEAPTAARPSRTRSLDGPVTRLSGIGPRTARLLERLGVHTIDDLLWHLPRRHEDRRTVRKITQLREGETVCVEGVITSVTTLRPKRVTIVRAVISDGTGHLALTWFNRAYLGRVLRKGLKLVVCGRPERPKMKSGSLSRTFQMASPEYEETGEDGQLSVGRIVPVYPATEGLNQNALRKATRQAVVGHAGEVTEFLPRSVLVAQNLMPRARAFEAVHFPDTPEQRDAALERLIFEELFVMQVGLALRRRETERLPRQCGYRLDDDAAAEFERTLSFALTGAQRRVLDEMLRDLARPAPMSRLVQGDVGSGKTVVAAFAAWMACRSGYQAAIMAPTEILAEQLSRKIQDLLGQAWSVRLLKGAMTGREKDAALTDIALGQVDVAVGTHALIQEDVRFARLAMAVVDEQHKFGVMQRSQLRNKGYNPDVLVMTATPIPRTLALTVYGDLDVSIIDELPPGRSPVRTRWIRTRQADSAYRFVRGQVAEGRQAYVVCPLIEESEADGVAEEETGKTVAAAVAEAERLRREVFPDLRVGLLHGRMRSDEKEREMEAFRQGDLHVLVSTTVIEVGVDVPNATVMLIQNADRFGLAQLHQLRGRVGRGGHQSYCILLAEPAGEEGVQRMKIMEATSDGFRIAEEDLKFRGPGDFYGSRQSGLPDLRVADLVRDFRVLERARRAAAELVARDPVLTGQECGLLRLEVLRTFRGHLAHLLS